MSGSRTGGSETPHFGVVVLTMGQRPDDLRRGLESVLAQEGVTTDVVVVGNGWVPVDLPDGVRGHALPENVGHPRRAERRRARGVRRAAVLPR